MYASFVQSVMPWLSGHFVQQFAKLTWAGTLFCPWLESADAAWKMLKRGWFPAANAAEVKAGVSFFSSCHSFVVLWRTPVVFLSADKAATVPRSWAMSPHTRKAQCSSALVGPVFPMRSFPFQGKSKCSRLGAAALSAGCERDRNACPFELYNITGRTSGEQNVSFSKPCLGFEQHKTFIVLRLLPIILWRLC